MNQNTKVAICKEVAKGINGIFKLIDTGCSIFKVISVIVYGVAGACFIIGGAFYIARTNDYLYGACAYLAGIALILIAKHIWQKDYK